MILVQDKAVNHPQIDNPDVKDDFPSNDSVASNDWDNVTDNNPVLDNPAVAKRTAQDDTGPDGSVAYCNTSGFSSLFSTGDCGGSRDDRHVPDRSV